MRTLRLQVERKNEEGLITADRMRVDVEAEFYVRVANGTKALDAVERERYVVGRRSRGPRRSGAGDE